MSFFWCLVCLPSENAIFNDDRDGQLEQDDSEKQCQVAAKNRPGSNENTGCAIFKSLSYSSAGYGYAISLQQLSLGRSAVSGDRGIAKVRRRVCIRESHGRY